MAYNTSVRAEPAVLDRSWGTVAATTVGLVFSVGTLLLYPFGVFLDPLHDAFGWSKTAMFGALAASQYMLALAAPFWGALIDRFGPRAVVVPSTIMISALIASLALLTPNIYHFYAVFIAVPLLAGGATPIGYSAVLVRKFERHLGLALGLCLMGVGVGAFVLPNLANLLAQDVGWREAYAALGGLCLLFTLPAALYVTRGDQTAGRPLPGASRLPILPLVRTRAFVLMSVIFVLLGTVSVGMLVNFRPAMISHGFSPAIATQIASVTGLTVIVGRAGIGWLLDQFHPPLVVCGIALVAVASFLLVAYGEGAVPAYAAAALLGTTVGAEVDFTAFFVRRYFGNAVFGRLYGLVFGIFIIGSGTGPLLLSALHDRFGEYNTGALIYAALGLVAALLTFAMPSFNRTPAHATA